MHKYIVKIFRKVGAKNVLWVFSPNAESVPNTSYKKSALWNTVTNYYPGDEYVDILGMDGYNWGETQTVKENGWKSKWLSFEKTFENLYEELKKLSKDKPIMVFETASASLGGNKTEWIKRWQKL